MNLEPITSVTGSSRHSAYGYNDHILPPAESQSLNYATRLETFSASGQWTDNLTTARQLSVLGHVSDHPPLQLEIGSHCIACDKFIPQATSIGVLEGSISSSGTYVNGSFSFHITRCERLQLRFPLEPHKSLRRSIDFSKVRGMWERKVQQNQAREVEFLPRASQSSSLFSLPTEVRLIIYDYVLPSVHGVNKMMPLHRDSMRIVPEDTLFRPRRLDTTKANLLLTCKVMHSEALNLLYTGGTFRFDCSRDLYLFLRGIGHWGRQLLTSVELTSGDREDAIALSLLASCERLNTFTIRINRAKLVWRDAPMWVHEGAACLLALDGLETASVRTLNYVPTSSNVPVRVGSSPMEAYIEKQLLRPRGTVYDSTGFEQMLDNIFKY
jgi:hypothetical protein